MKIRTSSSPPVITFASTLFLLCVFCVTVVHYMHSDARDAFRFGGGDVLREGAVGGGCEPKDIISLGDDYKQHAAKQRDKCSGQGSKI